MSTFGRMRLDVENCLQRAGRVRRRRAGSPGPPPRYGAGAAAERPASAALLDTFLERRATISTEDQSPSVQRFREMIGRDEKMLIVFEWIRTAAKSDISVLILGPTGSGKEVVARMIHELSRRGPRELPGGQLRGAARHAVRVGDLRLRKGRVHRRQRPQARTARAGRPRHAVPRRDRRPVAGGAGQAAARARGSPLRAARRPEVGARRLPADLGDQPPARPVRPRQPLPRGSLLPRQRLRHPPAVAARAAGRTSRCSPTASSRATARPTACRSTRKAFSPEALTLLQAYPWPGNIRELESTVSRAALSAPGRVIRDTDIEFLHAHSRRRRPSASTRLPTLADAERAHIAARARTPWHGTRRRRPRLLDISRGTLYRKIVEYDLEPDGTSVPKQDRRSLARTIRRRVSTSAPCRHTGHGVHCPLVLVHCAVCATTDVVALQMSQIQHMCSG